MVVSSGQLFSVAFLQEHDEHNLELYLDHFKLNLYHDLNNDFDFYDNLNHNHHRSAYMRCRC